MTNRGTAKSPRRIWGAEPQRISVKDRLLNHIIAHPNDTNPAIEWQLQRILKE